MGPILVLGPKGPANSSENEVTVLCDRCNALERDRQRTGHAGKVASANVHFCDACGDLLPVRDSIDGMLQKLTQLSRFGLDAESNPILLNGAREG